MAEKLTSGQKAHYTRVVNEFKKEAKEALEEIKNLKQILTSSNDEEESIYDFVKNTRDEIGNIRTEANQLYAKIFLSNDPTKKALADNIQGFVPEFEKMKTEVDNIKGEIDSYKRDLLGYKNDKGEMVYGMKDEIESTVKSFDELYEHNESKQEELIQEIEGLLKGASTVALAKSFKEHKDSFKLSNIVWIIVFILSIGAMMALSIAAFVHAEYEFKDMWKYTLGNLPFLGGAVWLAIYSSKQRSQNRRLQQEYAFKEDVAKIYYGLKKEIEELGESELGKKLNERIIEIIIQVVSLNPSNTLDSKYHNDKGPILESIAALTKAVKKE